MTIVGWTLYVCLSYGTGGLQCLAPKVGQISYIPSKELCIEAGMIIQKETTWNAYCLPVVREN